MRVKALEALSLYYNYGIRTLAPGEETKGGLALHLLATGANVEPLDDDARAVGRAAVDKPHPDARLDIEATAADVLDWVGEIPERAAEALEAELAKDKPRSTLVKQLEKLADSDGE